jgi:hypothetical protein
LSESTGTYSWRLVVGGLWCGCLQSIRACYSRVSWGRCSFSMWRAIRAWKIGGSWYPSMFPNFDILCLWWVIDILEVMWMSGWL